MTRLLPLLLAGLVSLAGCVEAEEAWDLDAKGGGTYRLTVRWDADLWRRAGDVLGPGVMGRLAGEGLPLRAATWRDSLAGVAGVEVLRAEEGDAEGGLRQVVLEVRFRRLRDLLAWDWIAGRRLRVATEAPTPGAEVGRARLTMEPIARVPVLDRLAALLEAVEKPPPRPTGAVAERDPGPLERVGIEPRAGELVWRMVKPALESVALTVRVRTPGALTHVGDRAMAGEGREASFSWTFEDLREARTDRRVRLGWRLRTLDEVPPIDHPGGQAAGAPAPARSDR